MADVDMESGSDDSGMVDFDEEIQKVKEKLEEDEKNITVANRLLELLHKNGDFDELAEKRREFVVWAPLTATNWIEWINDLVESENPPAKEVVYEMFRKALFDENEVAIWVERIFYVKKNEGYDVCRQTCEQALTAIGNRYDAGGHIWTIFLNYERERLALYQDSPELPNRVTAYLALCQRAVRCATTQLEDIYQETVQFCEENGQEAQIPSLKKIYETTARQNEQLEQFEELIKDPKTKRKGLEAFFEYEKKSGMPARVQMAHERMISELDDDENAWSSYAVWTEQVLKLPKVSMEVYERALRHCPYSFVLHQQALLAMERVKKPEEEIDQLWETAKNTINSADEGRSLYRTYIFLIRRRIVGSESEKTPNYEPMARIFEEGAENLAIWFDSNWDPNAEYRQMQAHFYAALLKNMEKCRTIWNDILASGSGKFAAKWIEAVRIERQFGDLQNARKYLNKALNSVSDNINDIYTYYVQFEREEGSLAELDVVLEKVNSQVAHRAARPQKKVVEKEKTIVPPVAVQKNQKKTIGGGEPGVKRVRDADGGFKVPHAPTAKKPISSATTPSSAPKPVAVAAAAGTEDARTIFVSNLDFKTTADDIRSVIEGVAEVRFARKAHSDVHRGFAYVLMENEEIAKEAVKKDRVPVKGRPMFIAASDPVKRTGFKYATGLEKSKVFVRNVHFQATDEELTELFAQFGKISSVRRVTHRDGKPKGMAYVDFETEEDARKCVTSAEKLMLKERELSVALSDPPKKEHRGKHAEDDGAPRRGHAAKLQMVPRALAKSSLPGPPQITARLEAMDTSDSPSTSSAPDASAAKPLSNDQFRALLFKK